MRALRGRVCARKREGARKKDVKNAANAALRASCRRRASSFPHRPPAGSLSLSRSHLALRDLDLLRPGLTGLLLRERSLILLPCPKKKSWVTPDQIEIEADRLKHTDVSRLSLLRLLISISSSGEPLMKMSGGGWGQRMMREKTQSKNEKSCLPRPSASVCRTRPKTNKPNSSPPPTPL